MIFSLIKGYWLRLLTGVKGVAPPWLFLTKFADPQTLMKNRNLLERFREVISDPLNLLINRVPSSGYVDSKGLVILHNGVRVARTGRDSYYGKFSEILILNRGVHEPLEEFAFQQLILSLPENPVMLEVGAYWAHYSMWLKLAKPNARCIMAEPDKKNLRVGMRNFKINSLGEGEFVNARIGNGKKRDKTLGQLLTDLKCETVHILHADIQGAELLLLQQSRSELESGAVQRVFISTHSSELHEQVLDYLGEINFEIEVSSDFSEHTTSQDGLIIGRAPRVQPFLNDFLSLGRVEICQANPATVLRFLNETQRKNPPKTI